MKSKPILTLLALTHAGAALAHPGDSDGAMAGLMHPLTGIDHILAMLAVGLWGAQLGGRAQWLLPASFAPHKPTASIARIWSMPVRGCIRPAIAPSEWPGWASAAPP